LLILQALQTAKPRADGKAEGDDFVVVPLGSDVGTEDGDFDGIAASGGTSDGSSVGVATVVGFVEGAFVDVIASMIASNGAGTSLGARDTEGALLPPKFDGRELGAAIINDVRTIVPVSSVGVLRAV
jgi:hypothetical protein